jgi:MATE family multidrug resistance protein
MLPSSRASAARQLNQINAMPTTILRELRALTSLAFPLVIAQLGMIGLWVVDLIMLGRVGVEALGAASLGRLVIMGSSVVAMGALLGLDPVAAQSFGAGDEVRFARVRKEATILAWCLVPVLLVIWGGTGKLLIAMGEDPSLSLQAHRYVIAQIWGAPFFLLFVVGRHLLQARGIMRPLLWVVLGGNVVNVLLNWVLIFGHLGLPALGLRGAGISTAATNGLMCLLVWSWVRRFVPKTASGDGSAPRWRWSGVGRIAWLGLPVALQVGMEYWAFGLSTLWAGMLGTIPLASHTVVIGVASISFMVPLGISLAAVTRVGNLLGADRKEEAQHAAWVAMALGSAVMCVFAFTFFVAREWIPRLYTEDASVIALAAAIFPIAGAFQLFDGLQVVGGGVLRGMGRTRPAAVFNLIGYYVLGLPLAWWLVFRRGAGLAGIWWGLSLGLAVVAILLVVWIRFRGPRHAERLA